MGYDIKKHLFRGAFDLFFACEFLPSWDADCTDNGTCHCDEHPEEDRHSPTLTLGNQRNSIGGDRAADVDEGVEQTGNEGDVALLLEERRQHGDQHQVDAMHTTGQHCSQANGSCCG